VLGPALIDTSRRDPAVAHMNARLHVRIEQCPLSYNPLQFSEYLKITSATLLEIRALGKKSLNKDGHLITEDSVLPTTAPGGAPEQNRCYQTPATLFVLPLAPTPLARSAHLAPLTTLRPRWGLALFS
jgi:hypothetical protein